MVIADHHKTKRKMIELLAFVAVVVIVIVAIRIGRQDDAPSYSQSSSIRAGGLSEA